MKTNNRKNHRRSLPFLAVLLLTTSLALNAQNPGPDRPFRQELNPTGPRQGGNLEMLLHTIPDITPDQEANIRVLHTQFLTQTTPIHAAVMELQAKLQAQAVANEPDFEAMN